MENKNTIIAILEAIISTAEKFRNAYFFNSPGNAASRRSYEQYYSIPKAVIEYNGDIYTVEYSVSCSCANVYAKGYYTKNGKKTTLTAIKNLYRKIKEV